MKRQSVNLIVEALNANPASLWEDDDLSALFRHQLSVRLEPELAEWAPETLRSFRSSAEVAPMLSMTLADLLRRDPPPPNVVLAAMKELGKAITRDGTRGVPKDVGKMLYFLSIAASLASGGEPITELDRDVMSRGLSWAAGRSWVDERSRQLLRSACDRLQP